MGYVSFAILVAVVLFMGGKEQLGADYSATEVMLCLVSIAIGTVMAHAAITNRNQNQYMGQNWIGRNCK